MGWVSLKNLTTAAITLVSLLFIVKLPPSLYHRIRFHILRNKLPRDLRNWRNPTPESAGETYWQSLEGILRQNGLILWPHYRFDLQSLPHDSPLLPTGYSYVLPSRSTSRGPGGIRALRMFRFQNHLSRAARLRESGMDVVLRVIATGKEGHTHLSILRRLSEAPLGQMVTNHALPLLRTVEFDDIVLGVFPRLSGVGWEAYRGWPRNSQGDFLQMVLQMLEALVFIHEQKIAHRDVFLDNFFVQFQPESLGPDGSIASQPRVFLGDFEVAVDFDAETPLKDCLCVGIPIDGSLQIEKYSRPLAPELAEGPYNPFQLDVWQLATSILSAGFTSQLAAVDDVFQALVNPEPSARLQAQEAYRSLSSILASTLPSSLSVPFPAKH